MRILLLFLFLSATTSFGQRSLKDSAIGTVLIGLDYKANFPVGDLAERWGFNNQLGLDMNYKFKNSWTAGVSGGFIFGNQLQDSTIFESLFNSYGKITSLSGAPGSVLLLMRGFTAHANVGYVFNRLGNNPNSGLWVKAGVGYMMHKIRIESLLDVIPQLEGDYRKGYDKMTMGFSTDLFVGYLFQSDWRLLKFYGGVEFTQGFTKNVRTYNFDTGGPESAQRLDLMYGLKIGWIIPISQRTRSLYYND